MDASHDEVSRGCERLGSDVEAVEAHAGFSSSRISTAPDTAP